MNCNTEITLLDKYVTYVRQIMPDYEYSRAHFGLEGSSLLYWNLAIERPTQEQLESVTVAKSCPRTCIECLIRRIETVEKLLN